jgi:ABC-type uncharacterized transport system ATPase subunit
MEQVEQVCDDICLIAGGQPILNGSLRQVKARYGRDVVSIVMDGGINPVYRKMLYSYTANLSIALEQVPVQHKQLPN